MLDNFSRCLAFTLKEEGGVSDNPKDPGGFTVSGITLKAWRDWRNDQSLSPDDLRAISATDKAYFYMDHDWDPVNGSALPAGIDLMLFDFGVNAGTDRSAKLLQRIIGAKQDGEIGPKTLEALSAWNPNALVRSLAEGQMDHYRSLTSLFRTFGRGWTARTARRQSEASGMIQRNTHAI